MLGKGAFTNCFGRCVILGIIFNDTQRFKRASKNYQFNKQARSDNARIFKLEKVVLMSQLSSLKRKLKFLQERVSKKLSLQEHSHITLTKLHAELTSLQRKNKELANDKMELENTLKDLVLDKEQLGQEKETPKDQLEELKIDLESHQVELEDGKAHLEVGRDAKASAFEGDVEGNALNGGSSHNVAQSLALHILRLCMALIHLREQSKLERNKLQHQIKAC